MKTTFLILLLTLGTSAQSLDDTLKFVRDKMSLSATVSLKSADQKIHTTLTFQADKFESCDIAWRVNYYSFSIDETHFASDKSDHAVKVNIGLVDTKGIKVEPYQGNWSVHLPAINDQKAFLLETTHGGKNTGDVMRWSQHSIIVKDQESAEKLAKAFAHAAELCRQKKDLF